MGKISKSEQRFFGFVEKHKFIIIFMIITAVSLYLRSKLLVYESNDFTYCLKEWFSILDNMGGLKALRLQIGNYNAPYITILALLTYIPVEPLISIKMVSIIFDYISAFAIFEISRIILPDSANKKKYLLLIFAIAVFLPTVFLNSACWAQADSIYTAFVLISLLALLKKKYVKAFVFLGIAFSFKLQTIFILPLYIFMYISERKFSILNFLIIPIVDFVMCLPAISFGKSFIDCINVYVGQTAEYSRYLTMNFPNIYSLLFGPNSADAPNLIDTPDQLIISIGVLFTLFIFMFIAVLVFYKKVKFDNRAIIEFGLWSILIATFFLPEMHDRYLYMGDLIAILYLLYNKRKYYIPIAIELISLSTYAYYLFGATAMEIKYISLMYLVIVVLYSRDMYKRYLE